MICSRLASQIVELFQLYPNLRIIAVQPRGTLLAQSLKTSLKKQFDLEMYFGIIDASFYRDDIRSGSKFIIPEISNIDFEVENQPILLIDDVLCTGCTARAAVEALLGVGRPNGLK